MILEQQTQNRLLEEALVMCEARLDAKIRMVEQLKQEILTVQSITWCTPLKDSPMMLCKTRDTEVARVEDE